MECAYVCSPVDCETGRGWSPSISLSLSPTLLHSFFAPLPQGQTCHVAGAHSPPTSRSFSSHSALSYSLTFSGGVGQMEAQSLGTYFY